MTTQKSSKTALLARISKNAILSMVAMAGFVGAGMVMAQTAQASEPKLLSTHNDWSAYTFEENGSKVCYMASTPRKAEGKYTQRGEIYALITHRPAENTKDVFSYITGYKYKTGSDVSVKVDGKKYTLFTQDDTAWAPDAQSDRDLAKAIQAGSTMIVQGVSGRGTKTKDTFSLKGSTAAYKAISRACGK